MSNANRRYIFQRRGGPLLSWQGGPPSQTRAADAKSLGSLSGDVFDANPLGLPRPGSPEFLDNYEVLPSSSPPIKQRGVGGVAEDFYQDNKLLIGIGVAMVLQHFWKKNFWKSR